MAARLKLTPNTRNFPMARGEAIPAAQTVVISNAGDGTLAAPTLSAIQGPGAPYLTATLTGSTVTITVTSMPTAPGLYPYTIPVTSLGAMVPTKYINGDLAVSKSYRRVLDKRVTEADALLARILPVSSNSSVIEIVDDAVDTCTAFARRTGSATVSKSYNGVTHTATYTVEGIVQPPVSPVMEALRFRPDHVQTLKLRPPAFPYTPPDGMNQYGEGSVHTSKFDIAAIKAAQATNGGVVRHTTTLSEFVNIVQNVANRGDIITVPKGAVWEYPAMTLRDMGAGQDTTNFTNRVWVMSRDSFDGTFPIPACPHDDYTLADPVLRGLYRFTPSDATADTPILRMANNASYITVKYGPNEQTLDSTTAGGWAFHGLIFETPTIVTPIVWSMFAFGPVGQSDPAKVATDFVFNQCIIRGRPTQSLNRAITANCKRFAIVDSWVDEVHRHMWGDTQAVWCSEGAYRIKMCNNTLRVAGENFLCGGTEFRALAMLPESFEFRFNHSICPPEWNDYNPASAGTPYASMAYRMKNLYELKNGWKAWLEGNVFEGSFVSGQNGHGFFCQVIMEGGEAGDATRITDIAFRHNIIKSAYAFCGFGGRVGAGPARRISAATATSPIIITTADPHQWVTGMSLSIAAGNSGLRGLEGIHDNVTVLSPTTAQLNGSSGFGTFVNEVTATYIPRNPIARVEMRDNLGIDIGFRKNVTNVDYKAGYANQVMVYTAMRDFDFVFNTIDNGNNTMPLAKGLDAGGPSPMHTEGYRSLRVRIIGNVLPRGEYGVTGDSGIGGEGAQVTHHRYATDSVLTDNIFYKSTLGAQGNLARTYPQGNLSIPYTEIGFTDAANGDFTITGQYAGYGANISRVRTMTLGVVQ